MSVKSFFRYFLALPTFGIGFGYVALACLLGFAKGLHVEDGIFWATWRDWWAQKWRYSTTATRGIILHPNHEQNDGVIFHEMVHVRQAEDLCAHGLLAAILAALWGQWWLAFWLWHIAPAGHLLNYLMAWLRGLDPYYGAEHERAAYAQEELRESGTGQEK